MEMLNLSLQISSQLKETKFAREGIVLDKCVISQPYWVSEAHHQQVFQDAGVR